MSYRIPFNKPFIVGRELHYMAEAVVAGQTAGEGRFVRACERLMEERFGARRVLLTTSCTSALEMAAILCDLEPGDEVILPSYTFVSTANAFALPGGKIGVHTGLLEVAANQHQLATVLGQPGRAGSALRRFRL